MRRIAELSEAELSSGRFLQNTFEEIEKFPWIVGCVWQSPDGQGQYGKTTEFDSAFRYHDLEITFFTEIRMSPAMFLHLRLLAQVVGEFYEGKRREQVLKQNAYMQAVHETGARLTHDMKNLLQSLYALTSASSAKPLLEKRRKSDYEALLERQLPQLAKRLQSTLDKLQNPALGAANVMIPLEEWWQDAQARHSDSGIVFTSKGALVSTIPANLFDAVLENCLENTRKKKIVEPMIGITAEIAVGADYLSLSITDTGGAIPSGAASELFRAPIANTRRGGYGIGLFQAHRQAAELGYALTLASNRVGEVRFELKREEKT
jgi:K+-sensing histidine kinase KdpD